MDVLICYAWRLSYLMHIVFSSASILHHYDEFDLCTMDMLEKLLCTWSFNITVGHLAHCQVILLVF
jgi:hypothetical protein